jgi:lycopene beta-cyclase
MKKVLGLVGFGASNMLLLLEMEKAKLLGRYDVLIFDECAKEKNDKTYCFWASPNDDIVQDFGSAVKKEWQRISTNVRSEGLNSLKYYMLESSTLYTRAKMVVSKYSSVRWIRQRVESIDKNARGVLICAESTDFKVDYVSDSRFSPMPVEDGLLLKQSFLGWKIRVDRPAFTEDTIMLMDFDLPQDESTQFMYVLPTTSEEALVELTRFGTELIDREQASIHLKAYLKGKGTFKLLDEEYGIIPMSIQQTPDQDNPSVWSMGSRAGMVKPSTGYAFRKMYEDARACAAQLSAEVPYLRVRSTSRFQYYDRLLITILKYRPKWGRPVFERLFSAMPYEQILLFLDEKSTLGWELRMFSKLPILKFLWAVVMDLYLKRKNQFTPVLPLLFSLVLWVFSFLDSALFMWGAVGVLGLLFLVIGIPHGALDGFDLRRRMSMGQFIFKYLIMMFFIAILWLVVPIVGLAVFLLFSAWHFGQTDFEEWGLSRASGAFVWGVNVLALMLMPHLNDVAAVLRPIGFDIPELWLHASWEGIWFATIVAAFIQSIVYRRPAMVLTIMAFCVSAQVGLWASFGVYFVMQHSLSGWRHLRTANQWTNVAMWKKSAPFTLGGVLVLAAAFVFRPDDLRSWFGYAAVLLSMISLPHVYFMSLAYFRKH